MRVLVCASANAGKVAEIEALLDGRVELLPRPGHVSDVEESADTLEGNARLKAIAVVQATAMPAVADDTGLEVDALDGAPGVRTARYAGEHATDADNRFKLLTALAGGDQRTARFRTCVVAVWPDGREVVVDGVCEGRINDDERGARGFGYDAVFVPLDGDGRTFAEMSDAEKNAISHRGKAFHAMMAALDELVD